MEERRTLSRTCPWGLWLAILHLVALPSSGEEPVLPPPPSQGTGSPLPATFGEVSSGFAPIPDGFDCTLPSYLCHSNPGAGILTFPLYVNSGVTFDFDSGLLERHVNPGFVLQFGARQPLWNHCDLSGAFFELGGEYRGNDGDSAPVATSGSAVFSSEDGMIPKTRVRLEDFLKSKLQRIDRGSAHLAVGLLRCPEFCNGVTGRQVWLSLRGGGRVGHVRARFDKEPTAALQAVSIAQRLLRGDAFRSELNSDVGETDTFWGLFGTVGLEVSWMEASWCPPGVAVATGINMEWSHDWFDLGDYGRNDAGLGNLAFLAHLTFSF